MARGGDHPGVGRREAVVRSPVARSLIDPLFAAALLDSTGEGLFSVDRKGRCTFANRAAGEMLGYRPGDLLGVDIHRQIHHTKPDGSPFPVQECPITTVFRTGEGGRAPQVFFHREGQAVPVHATFFPVLGKGVSDVVVGFTDVSERDRLERELARSEALNRATFEASLDALVVMNAQGAIIDLNPKAEELFGLRREEAIGSRVADTLVPVHLREAHRAGLHRYLSSGISTVLGSRVELSALRADGSEFPVELSITRLDLPGPPLFAGWIRELTERHRATEELAAGERRLRALIDASSDAIFLTDRDLNIVLTNRGAQRLTGRTPDEVADQPRWSSIHPEDRQHVQAGLAALGPSETLESRFRLGQPDGSYRWVEMRAVNGVDDPDVGGYVTTLRDVTNRMAAEEALQQAEARYRSLIEQIPAVTFIEVADEELPTGFRTAYASPQVETMFGYSPDEWLADPDLRERLLVPEDRERTLAENAAATRERRPFHLKYRMRARDGHVVWVREDSRPVTDHEGRLWMWHGVMFDVTDEELAREQLARSGQRLTVLHDIDRAILSRQEPSDLAHSVAEHLREVLRAERVSVIAFEPTADQARIIGASQTSELGPDESAILPLSAFVPPDQTHRSLIRYAPDLAAVERRSPNQEHLFSNGVRSILSCSLTIGQQSIGELNVSTSRANAFTPEDRDVMLEISDQLAIALEQSRLRERLEERVRVSEALVEDLRRTDDERRRLLGQVVAAEEKERRAIAEGIHDDSIQRMTAVGIRLNSLRRKIVDEEQVAVVDQIAEAVSGSISRLRLLLFELHPRSLETGRLGDAIREYLELSDGGSGFQYQFEDRIERLLSPVVRTTAYRIVQEALANCRKHSQAERVWIVLEPRDGGVAGRVEDDGVGIGEIVDEHPGHLGLPAMRERAERLGGWALVTPRAGGGTVVEFWLPA
jgi:PAS domain S-box-containing protein